jgi:acyl carrier protein
VTADHDRLLELFRTVLGDDELVLHDHTTAEDVPDWDSLAHVNLMFSIEEQFGVQFRDNEFAELRSIGELRRYLEVHARH